MSLVFFSHHTQMFQGYVWLASIEEICTIIFDFSTIEHGRFEEEEETNSVHEKELSDLRLGVAKHKVDLERAIDHIHYLEEVNLQQGLARAEVEAKYQAVSMKSAPLPIFFFHNNNFYS